MMIPITVTALCFLLQSSITSGRALAFNHHPNSNPLISRSLNLNFGRDLFAPLPPSATIKRRHATTTTAHLRLASNSDNDQKDDGDDFLDVNVAGVSVSPSGFIVLLQSILNIDNNSEKSTTVAFPIALTSPPNENPSSSSNTSNVTMLPELFRENHDQTSVTSPEALTFLQLLNGVDMATPILPPDTLSLICVWYAFLLEEQEDRLGDGDEGGELVLVEDELGLSTATTNDDDESSDNKFQVALEYIRAMVRTTLPPNSDGSDGITSYMDTSPWQRARVKLPHAWLRGVRIQELEDHCLSTNSDSTGIIGRVPLQFILECSVDDGSKMLEIPLLVIPGNISIQQQQQKQQLIDMSNKILQELSQNFNGETSAAFMSLALFHRYNKSGAGSADSPVLKVSHELLKKLVLKEGDDDCQMRYCWLAPVSTNKDEDDKEHEHDDVNTNSIDTIIQKNVLPLYRTLNQIQEEDQRVLQHLKQENFGDGDSSSSSTSNNNNKNEEMDNNIQKQQQQPKKKSLTLEQQAMQQRLTSAWKIATQREDAGALEKIQKAMEDLEKEVMENAPGVVEECAKEAGEGASSLQKIQRAMQQGDRSQQISREDEGQEEEVVGLISELEEATSSRMQEQMMDEEEEEK